MDKYSKGLLEGFQRVRLHPLKFYSGCGALLKATFDLEKYLGIILGRLYMSRKVLFICSLLASWENPKDAPCIFNKIVKPFDKACTGWSSIFHRFRMYVFKILAIIAWNWPATLESICHQNFAYKFGILSKCFLHWSWKDSIY